jgi:hypothetical protein
MAARIEGLMHSHGKNRVKECAQPSQPGAVPNHDILMKSNG